MAPSPCHHRIADGDGSNRQRGLFCGCLSRTPAPHRGSVDGGDIGCCPKPNNSRNSVRNRSGLAPIELGRLSGPAGVVCPQLHSQGGPRGPHRLARVLFAGSATEESVDGSLRRRRHRRGAAACARLSRRTRLAWRNPECRFRMLEAASDNHRSQLRQCRAGSKLDCA